MTDKLAESIRKAIAEQNFEALKGEGPLHEEVNALFSLIREKSQIEDQVNELALKTLDSSHLIHLMCHDLRNPIGTSFSFLEILKEELEEKDEEVPYLKEIEHGLDFSLKVIENVQSLMALNSGKLRIDLDYYNVSELVHESIKMIRHRFPEKNVTIDVDVPEDLMALTHKNYAILSVFNNLLSNAIKFSPPSGVVEIKALKDQQTIVCTVRDHGIGMPKEILENLFALDKATNRSGTSGEQGTGFGMTLVKRFMEAFEGQVYVESNDQGEDTGTLVKLQFWAKP